MASPQPDIMQSQSHETTKSLPAFSSYVNSVPPSPRYESFSAPDGNEELDFGGGRIEYRADKALRIECDNGTQGCPLPAPEVTLPASAARPSDVILPRKAKAERKKRGKYKTKKSLAENPVERESRRLEKNRECAKESRVRKKKYIESLEQEIRILKEEMETYKRKLAEYEKIEKLRNINCLAAYKALKEECLQSQPFYEAIKEICPAIAMKSFVSKYVTAAEERLQAIDQLSRTTIEVMLPVTHKYLLWAAENGSGMFNPENIEAKLSGSELKIKDEWDEGLKGLDITENDLRSVYQSRPFFVHSAALLRALVGQFLATQREIKNQIRLVEEHVRLLATKVKRPTLCSFVKWFEKMKDRSELSDRSVYGLYGSEIYQIPPTIFMQAFKGSNYMGHTTIIESEPSNAPEPYYSHYAQNTQHNPHYS